MIALPSPNHGPRPPGTPIDTLVLHYTGMRGAAEALDRLCDPAAQVSAHYVVDEDGTVYALVDEDLRAWHAGRSWWRGQTDINSRSIGIELVNPGHEFGYRPFPAAQMRAAADLARDVLSRHPIPQRNIVGHSDIAPQRKEDPGEFFDWADFSRQGIGLWPPPQQMEAAPIEETEIRKILNLLGYTPEAPLDVIIVAFQRRYRPQRFDGLADPQTISLLIQLLRLVEFAP